MTVGFVSIIREPWGGSEELWATAAAELLQRKVNVIVSMLDTGETAPRIATLQGAGARLIHRRGFIKPGASFRERAPKKVIHFALAKIANPYQAFFSAKPDLVVYTGACDSLRNDPYFLRLLYAAKTPLVIINQVHYEYQKTFDEQEAAVLRQAFQYAKANLFVAERNREVMERFLAAPIPNASVVRNPVNLANVHEVPIPVGDPVCFAMVANLLVNHKGHDIVLDVLRQPKWQDRPWHLNLYGGGVDRGYIEQLVNHYALGGRVSFHGRVQDIREVWKQNHLLLMPSRLEGTPLALVEAMLCGRPSVVTDVGGHLEWIAQGKEGFVAEGANVLSFDRALETAWQHRSQWAKIGRAARLRALVQYDPNPGKTLADLLCKL